MRNTESTTESEIHDIWQNQSLEEISPKVLGAIFLELRLVNKTRSALFNLALSNYLWNKAQNK